MFRRMDDFRARFQRQARLLLFGVLAAVPVVSDAVAKDDAVFIMYHRFGESEYPSTNVTLQQFEAHIELLTSGAYTVLPVPEIIAAMQAGTPLPDKTVGITIDDAYLSVYEHAWPRLKKAGLPFTVFVATQPVDIGTAKYLSWDQIREMKAAGVTIGGHTVSHLHMVSSDMAKNGAELDQSAARFEAELGEKPSLFAYPYGEASHAVRQMLIDRGYVAAFGQHSGVSYRSGDRYFLPRFAFNETFSDMSHFRQRVNAMALPAIEISPADPLVTANPPAFGFTVAVPLDGLGRLACYHPHFDAITVERLGAQRFEVRFPAPFKRGRSRLNCTVPGPDKRYRWFGWQFYVE